ncbi:acyl-CoA dehydrogenase [Nocardioides endophyticus]|uniref:Acyl-CoA dehydrogenase n=1 Tax=Nocardioides endophyticus TaxID=1353775 RepID=A0ABP8YGB5_9ACTN
MSFSLSEESLDLQNVARQFAQREIAPNVHDWEREGHFAREVFKGLGELGFLGAAFPESVGGSEMGLLNMVLGAEQVGLASPDLVSAFNMNAMTAPMGIMSWGTPDQHEEYVRPLIQGDLIGSIALTEAGGGSDAMRNMKTRAVLKDGSWVINGTKMWITLSPVADVCLLFAKTDFEAGHRGVSAFILRYDDPGVTVTRLPTTTGNLIPVGEVVLDNVRIPEDRLVGEVGAGFKIAMNSLDYGRLAVAAKSLSVGQVLADLGIEYAKTREAFGNPIGRYQMIQHQIADAVTELTAGRALLYQAAATFDSGLADTRMSAMAKYFLGEVTLKIANAVMEIHGGYGVSQEYTVNHYLNLAHLGRTGEGAANILRIALAEDALGYKSMSRHALRRPLSFEPV